MKSELKSKAQQWRMLGRSIKQIAGELGVSQSTVSVWVRNIPISIKYKRKLDEQWKEGRKKGSYLNKQKGLLLRQRYQDDGRKQAKTGDLLHLMGCMLYWAEGTKDRNSVRFSNSDADMLLMFKRFLDANFLIQPKKYRLRLDCYLNNGLTKAEIENYWLDLLNLPRECLKKSIWKCTDKSYRKHKHPYGVCCLSVYTTEVVQHIYGAIQQYVGMQKDWL